MSALSHFHTFGEGPGGTATAKGQAGWGSNDEGRGAKKPPHEAGARVVRGWHRDRGSYWMRVRQYGHTFQSALSGRWQVGQTLRTCVLQIGQTTKSRSMGAPHLGQMP